MKSKFFFTVMALLMVLCSVSFAQVPQLINYQGKLTNPSGAPVTDTLQMVFTIYTDSGGTTSKWSETQTAVKVEKGVFNVLLGSVNPIPDSVFDGNVRYLGVKVGGDPEITPRKPMVSVPYAYRAGVGGGYWTFRVTDGADTTLMTGGQWGLARYGNALYGNADSTHVNLGVACTTGTSGQNYKYCTVGGGYSNTASGGIGVTVGGGDYNVASQNGATVGGGLHNTANGYHATVGGGAGNAASGNNATVGGGVNNAASDNNATIGGGDDNAASGYYATVGGGMYDTASGSEATVGGGELNTASGNDATVGGGVLNTASALYATVPGGYADTAGGGYSFAAGDRVRITSAGDYTFAFGSNFTTSASHAVIFHDSDTPIKVGIGTTSPGAALEVVGSGIANHLLLTNLTGPGAALRLNAVNKNWCIIGTNPSSSSGDQKLVFRDYSHAVDRMVIDSSGNVGIGTTSPQGALDVTSTTGALIVPRMTTAQRNALTAVNGMIIYNTTTNQFNFYEAGAWVTK